MEPPAPWSSCHPHPNESHLCRAREVTAPTRIDVTTTAIAGPATGTIFDTDGTKVVTIRSGREPELS